MVSSGYNSYKLVIDKLNKNVYDCNMKKLNNNKTKLIAVIKPDEKCLSELNLLFNTNERKIIVDELSKGYPVIKEVSHYASCKNIKLLEVYDSEIANNALNPFINTDEIIAEKSISFAVDAKGRYLSGDNDVINTENYNSKSGVQLSIDGKIQSIADCEISKIDKGSIVICDVDTNRILAMSSAGHDGINRCVSPCAVGSVFKLIVAACALENGINQIYYCNGEVTVGDTVFSCQNKTEHKNENMQTALENSCNCYFIELALKLGSEKLIKTARDFGFGSELNLLDNYSVSAGNLPDEQDLKSKGQLALLGFGQGKLNASPLAFCNAMCAIANGGLYIAPVILIGDVDSEGRVAECKLPKHERIISEDTSATMLKYMRGVVENGTGKSADYSGQSAGKTSTAQTGIYIDGTEILNTWFAGIYPYDNPKYAIVVTVEGGKSGAGDCCPIFRSLVEKIDKM